MGGPIVLSTDPGGEHACRVGAVAVSFHGLDTYHGLISSNIFHLG